MEFTLTDGRTLTTKVVFTDLHHSLENSVCNLMFKKKLYLNEVEIAIEEDIRVQINNTGIVVAQAKPRAQGARPVQQVQPTVTNTVLANAYTDFDKSNAAIEAIYTTYIAPLFA